MSRGQKLEPNKDANGDHTTFIKDLWGIILRYATYVVNVLNPNKFDEVKRVDLYGNKHFNKVSGENIPTPHVHEKNIPGEVRPANPDEIPECNKKIDDNE